MASGGGNLTFNYGMVIIAIVLMVGLPLCINLLASQPTDDDFNAQMEALNDSYYNFTGSKPVKEDVWGLEGIYTPYSPDGPRGYTSDGWLYGTKIINYSPTQYNSGDLAYTVTSRVTVDGQDINLDMYQYSSVGAGYAGIETGDIYTMVSMDAGHKSDIFFSPSNKHTVGDKFYYDYSGYRFAFKPIKDLEGIDDNGDTVKINQARSSCSLLWYQYYNLAEGISGQIVWNGSDGSTAYITAETLINNFNSSNNTSKHVLQFNGISLNLYVRLDPLYTSSGMSIKECFDRGYWSVMITSNTSDVSAYMATDYQFNPENIFQTVIDLMTFNLDAYGFSPLIAMFCSLVVIIPLYAGLLVIGLDNYKVLIFAGILLAIQSAVTIFNNWDWGGLF